MKNIIITVLAVLFIASIAVFGVWDIDSPEDVFEPINTGAKAKEYIKTEIGWMCPDTWDFQTSIMTEYKNKYGFYGNPMTVKNVSSDTVLLEGFFDFAECRQPTGPDASQSWWSVHFDPNNGFVYLRACAKNPVTDCTEAYQDENPLQANPDYDLYTAMS